jgi:glycosyltransferase involved in cell wall biosynthesis
MENSPSPISVLMPVRNGELFLPSILETILAGLESYDEVIIVNDGSTDLTRNILENWAKNYGQIRIFNSKGSGLVNALNLGLSASSNNWIARYDVDDVYPEYRLKEQRKLISEEVSAIFCDYSLWSPKINNIGVLPNAIHKSAVSVSLATSRRTPHPGVLFNRDKVLSVGGYQEKDFPAEDLSLWLRLSRVGSLIGIPKILLNYRISHTSILGTKRELAILKSAQVRSDYPIRSADIQYCLNNWEEIFALYDATSFGNERKILLLADLVKSLKLSELKSNVHFKMIRSMIFKVGTYSANYNLLRTRILKSIS